MSTLSDILTAMGDLFDFFITLFSELFSTITSTAIMWVPLAMTLLFVLVRKVPPLVKSLRKI